MSVGWEAYLDRLGPQGLRVILAGLGGAASLDDLLGRALSGSTSGDAVLRAVDAVAERPGAAPEVLRRLDDASGFTEPGIVEEDAAREELAALLREPRPGENAARWLHRLARSSRPPLPLAEMRAAAELLAAAVFQDEPATRPKYVAKVASERAPLKELEQERRELETRVRQLETQLQRALERSADLEDQLSQRVAELRTQRQSERNEREEKQRLEREAERLGRRIEVLNEKRARERTGEVTTALRRLTTEQRRVAAALEKMRESERTRRESDRLRSRRLDELSELVEKLVSVREAESRALAAAQEEILRELGELRRRLAAGAAAADAASEAAAPARRVRTADAPRVGIFVDVQNMFYAAREKNARLDFEALLAAACGERQLVRAVAYLVETKEIDQTAFIHLLQMKAYEVKRKPLRIRQDRTAKGNWDLEMALDAMTTAENLDVVVLVTGDGDFVPLVRQLKLRGLRVEVYGFPRSTAPDLREAADRFVAITRRLLRDVKPRREPPVAQSGS